MILLRPLCWFVGHLWEMRGWRSGWYCDRCGLQKNAQPKGW